MSTVLLICLLVLNFGISWYNAYVVGLGWYDAKGCSLWVRILLWSSAIMSASGFTFCYAAVLALGLSVTHVLSIEQATAVFNLVYLFIVFPVIGSGFAITVQSIAEAWRTRKTADVGVGAYNLFAQLYNTKEAWSGIPDAISGLSSFLSRDSKESNDNDKGTVLVILIALLALGTGVMTTVLIINKTATRQARRVLRQMSQQTTQTYR